MHCLLFDSGCLGPMSHARFGLNISRDHRRADVRRQPVPFFALYLG